MIHLVSCDTYSYAHLHSDVIYNHIYIPSQQNNIIFVSLNTLKQILRCMEFHHRISRLFSPIPSDQRRKYFNSVPWIWAMLV